MTDWSLPEISTGGGGFSNSQTGAEAMVELIKTGKLPSINQKELQTTMNLAGVGGVTSVGTAAAEAAAKILPYAAGIGLAAASIPLVVKPAAEVADNLVETGQKAATIPLIAGITPSNIYADWVTARDMLNTQSDVNAQRSQSSLEGNLAANMNQIKELFGSSTGASQGVAYQQPGGVVVVSPQSEGQTTFNWMPILLLGGLALAALFVLKKR